MTVALITLIIIAVIAALSGASLLYGITYFGKPGQRVLFYTRKGDRVHADEFVGLLGLCGCFGCTGALFAFVIWEMTRLAV